MSLSFSTDKLSSVEMLLDVHCSHSMKSSRCCIRIDNSFRKSIKCRKVNCVQFNSSKFYWKMCMDWFHKSSEVTCATEIIGRLAFVPLHSDSIFGLLTMHLQQVAFIYTNYNTNELESDVFNECLVCIEVSNASRLNKCCMKWSFYSHLSTETI